MIYTHIFHVKSRAHLVQFCYESIIWKMKLDLFSGVTEYETKGPFSTYTQTEAA